MDFLNSSQKSINTQTHHTLQQNRTSKQPFHSNRYKQICSYFPHGHQVELARRRAAARKAKLKAREKAPVVEGKWEKEEDFFTGQEHIPIMN